MSEKIQTITITDPEVRDIIIQSLENELNRNLKAIKKAKLSGTRQSLYEQNYQIEEIIMDIVEGDE